MRLRTVNVLLLSLCLAAIIACGKGDAAPNASTNDDHADSGAATSSGTAANTLRVVSPHPAAMQDEFEAGFKKWMKANHNKAVEIEWLDQGGTSQIQRFVQSEYKRSPEGINIDLFFGGGPDTFLRLKEDGILETYVVPDAILSNVGKEISGVPLYDPDHQWYGVALAGFGIMSNKVLQKRFELPAVETWEDLGNPALVGRVGTADPRNSGSAHMVYEIILQAYGWEKGWEILTKIGGNVKTFTTGASDVPQEVAIGNVIYGPVIDFYAYAQIVKTGRDKLGYSTPDGLSVVNADPIGILKGSPRLELAKRFVDYCLSEPAQKLLMLPVGDPEGPSTAVLARASVLPSLHNALGDRAVIESNPFKLTNVIDYDAVKGGARWDVVNDLFGALIVDTKTDLVASWKVVSASNDPAKMKRFLQAPITEAEADALALEWAAGDAALKRRQKVDEWRTLAQKKYQESAR